jgi:hypothetical protein
MDYLLEELERQMSKNKEWQHQGLCVGHPDPDLWHYDNSVLQDEQQLQVLRSVEAIEICSTCPVKWDCLQQGMEPENLLWSIGGNGSIWGGRLTSERALMKGYKESHNMVRHEQRHARNVKRKLGRILR